MSSSAEIVNKWAHIFGVIGNSERLAILLVLHGSKYTREKESLTFSDIKNILKIPSDASLSYQLEKLGEAELIEKKAAIKDHYGRVYPLYSVSQKWIDFVNEVGLADTLIDFVKKYPSP